MNYSSLRWVMRYIAKSVVSLFVHFSFSCQVLLWSIIPIAFRYPKSRGKFSSSDNHSSPREQDWSNKDYRDRVKRQWRSCYKSTTNSYICCYIIFEKGYVTIIINYQTSSKSKRSTFCTFLLTDISLNLQIYISRVKIKSVRQMSSFRGLNSTILKQYWLGKK